MENKNTIPAPIAEKRPKRKVEDLTEAEFYKLLETGMLWVLHPDAPCEYREVARAKIQQAIKKDTD